MSLIGQLGYKVKKILGYKWKTPSETGKVRYLVERYCIGYGCDIGFGGDKIMKTNCDGIDYEKPYTYTGDDKVDIACDVINQEIPVPDNTYDYVYSSHLIEDFTDTKSALMKFIRILKSEGKLILVFPDQKKYEVFCRENNQPLNMHHVHQDMGKDYMLKVLDDCEGFINKAVFISDCEIDYNVIIVTEILKNSLN